MGSNAADNPRGEESQMLHWTSLDLIRYILLRLFLIKYYTGPHWISLGISFYDSFLSNITLDLIGSH